MAIERPATARPSRAFSILGDEPARLGQDRLGFELFAASLAGRLLTSVEQTPFTVGILGDWGRGKTTVMRMLQARLEQDGCPTVWFEPWKYNDREGVWKGLALTLVRQIRESDSLMGELRRKRGALTRVAGGFLWSRLLGDRWGERLIEAATSEPWSAASLHRMEETLEELFRLIDPQRQGSPGAGRERRPLVLFIDDLDRCLPEAARSVLEAVKLVLARPGLITVLGLAEGELARAVHAAYAESMQGSPDEIDPDWGRKYIQKIIQMPFPMPQVSVESFEDYVGHCLEASGIGPLLGDRSDWRAIVREACSGNLREVKRFLNHFISEMDKTAANLGAARDEGHIPSDPARVAFILLLAWRFRDFYRHVLRSARLDLLIRYQLALTSDLEEEKTAEILRDPDQEFHLDPELKTFFQRCLRTDDGAAPLVRQFRDWREAVPYLQFGLLPVTEVEGGEGAKTRVPKAASRPAQKAATRSAEPTAAPDKGSQEVAAGEPEKLPSESPVEPDAAPREAPVEPGHSAFVAAQQAQGLLASARYEEAETKLTRAIRRAEKQDDDAGAVLLLQLLAEALQKQGRAEEGVKMLHRSIALTDERSPQLVESLILYSEMARAAEKLPEASKAAARATELAAALDDPISKSRALSELGKSYAAEGDHVLAQKAREELLDLAEELGQPTLKAEALVQLALSEIARGRSEAAEGDLREAIKIAIEIGLTDLAAEAQELLDRLAEEETEG